MDPNDRYDCARAGFRSPDEPNLGGLGVTPCFKCVSGRSLALGVLGTILVSVVPITGTSAHATGVSLRSGALIQPGALLIGEDEPEAQSIGWDVAISADGNTALVSSPDGQQGGNVWGFTRSGSSWTQHGPPMHIPGAGGVGFSVALSADGDTALIGAFASDDTWVYTRNASGWTNDGPLPGAGGVDCGISVALSASGNTALAGCPSDFGGDGSVHVYQRSGSTWSEETRLFGIYGEGGETPEGAFGRSVALSADGDTALVGGFRDNSRAGAAWVFEHTGSAWSQEGPKLTATDETEGALLGENAALSADGSTALLGGNRDNGFTGAAWVFAKTGSSWTQQGDKLTADDEVGDGQFGLGVALSADGNTALIGGPGDSSGRGALWTFERSGSTWSQSGTKLVDPTEGAEEFGYSIALSTDGYTALVGQPGYDSSRGAARAYLTAILPPPAIKKIAPKKGAATGETAVTITGTNFTDITGVEFGTVPAASFSVNSAMSITAVSPPGTSGAAQVTVTTPWGSSPSTTKAQFNYASPTIIGVSPSSGPKGGGTRVTITGTGFALGASTSISFGKAAGISVACSSSDHCEVTAPAVAKPATVSVIASIGKARSKKTTVGDYTYE